MHDPANHKAFAQKQQHGPLTKSCHKSGLAKHLKVAMKASRETNAMEHLRSRTATTWSATPSYVWLQALTNPHPRLCGAIPRYALLRWSIGDESDCAFWKRSAHLHSFTHSMKRTQTAFTHAHGSEHSEPGTLRIHTLIVR